MDLKNLNEPEGDDTRVYIQGRVRLEALATLALWMKASGIPPRSRSHLVHSAVEFMVEILGDNKVPIVKSTAEAVNILASMGITWPQGSITSSQIIKGLRLEVQSGEEDLILAAQKAYEKINEPTNPSVTNNEDTALPDWEE